MQQWGTRLFRTVVGKTIAGVVVVTVGVGAAAAGGAEVPLLRTAAADEVDDSDDREEDEFDEVDEVDEVDDDSDNGDDGSDDGDDDSDNGDAGSDDGDDDSDNGDDGSDDGDGPNDDDGDEMASVDGDEDGDEDGEPNHGQVVSEFTRTTELTGCEKGQATAAVARGDVDPMRDDLDDPEGPLATFLERCARDDDEGGSEDETTAAPGWKQTRDEGRVDRDAARQAFVEACGDDGLDTDAGSATDEALDDADDDGKSPECEALHAAAKEAHTEWKVAWHTERDEAKGQRGPKQDAEPEPAAESGAADQPGPPEHAKAGKRDADRSSTADKGQGNGNGKGKGKP